MGSKLSKEEERFKYTQDLENVAKNVFPEWDKSIHFLNSRLTLFWINETLFENKLMLDHITIDFFT